VLFRSFSNHLSSFYYFLAPFFFVINSLYEIAVIFIIKRSEKKMPKKKKKKKRDCSESVEAPSCVVSCIFFLDIYTQHKGKEMRDSN
jgi:hypothetical protein